MAIYKCKMCGGDLEVADGLSVATCEYCGTAQTLPKLSDEKIANLHDRANHFRRNNEFDKAMGIYEQILNEDGTDAEAYWSLVLCRYGIEYVEDPASHKRVPTINRAQFTSIFDDNNYKSALQYADAYQRHLYEEEAKAINEIQKGILAISQKEEPFDVFICYKETDNNGRRTPDSVLAQELYYQLKQEGFKVFFSRITLEDKLGSAYEPYIFAALNSAKVMVVLGTKPEHFNAVWVKNEWSRYLSLIKNGAQKMLIPAYRDMDPYNLPEEFSHLQAQDMSKLGFMQDLIRGIKKIVRSADPKPTVIKETVTSAGNASTAPLLKRVFIFLEDSDWTSADEYAEKVLDIDPECAEAYLGKLLAEMKIQRREKLAEENALFDDNPNYKKAMRYGGEQLQAELKGYIKAIADRAEYARLLAIYKKGVALLGTAKTEQEYANAAEVFEPLGDFEDSAEKAQECREKEKACRERETERHFGGLYVAAVAAMNSAKSAEEFIKAKNQFDKISAYKDSAKLSAECAEKADYAEKDAIYAAAVALMVGNKAKNYKKAIKQFENIRDFKDSSAKIELCNQKIEQIGAALGAAKLEKQNRAEAREEAFKEKLPLIKKIALVLVPVVVVAIVAVTVLPKIDWSGLSNLVIKNPTTTASTTATAEGGQSGTSGTSTTTNTSPSSSGSTTTTNKPTGNTTAANNPSPTSPSPSGGSTSDFYFSYTGNEIEILQYLGRAKTVVIPSKINGVKVTIIGAYAFHGCEAEVTSVTIPDTVTSIGEWAFGDCSGLTKITIPDSVKSVGKYAFSGCGGLTNVTIGNGVTSIGERAFEFCRNLTSVTIPNSVTSIGEEPFRGCTGLTKITLPFIGPTANGTGSEMTFSYIFSSDGHNSFDVPDSLKEVVITKVSKIVDEAFCGCDNLTSITIPNSVTSIGDYAFSGCSNLTSITIPDSVTSIGDGAFSDCIGLTKMTIPNSVTSIGAYTFEECTKLTSVVLPDSVKNIGHWAFRNCTSLTSITIPGSVKRIDDFLYNCTSLTSVTIGNGVTSIGSNAFRDCTSLRSITIPDSVTTIDDFALHSCPLETFYFQSEAQKERVKEMFQYVYPDAQWIVK